MATRGLVLGAGGALGAAWTVGALVALAEVENYDPHRADIVLGTSAGSVIAALLACGVQVKDLEERLERPGTPHVEGTGPVNPFDVHTALAMIPRPVPLPGNLRLAARAVRRPTRHTMMTWAAAFAPRGRGTLEPLAALIAEAANGILWPTRPTTWITAMDFDTGRRVVFGRGNAPQVSLADAVVASCAAPAFFPPLQVDGRRYVDGGAVSVTNADALLREGLSEVLILAPMATFVHHRPWSATAQADLRLRKRFTHRLGREVAQLRDAGVRVRILAPTTEDLDVIGLNMMNPARRREVLERAMETTREQLLGDLPDFPIEPRHAHLAEPHGAHPIPDGARAAARGAQPTPRGGQPTRGAQPAPLGSVPPPASDGRAQLRERSASG